MDAIIVRSGAGLTIQGSTGNAVGITYMPIVGCTVSTSNTSSSPLSVGSVYVDPAALASFTQFDFEAVLNVTGTLSGLTAYAKLYDVTGASNVATASSTSTTQAFARQTSISIPGSAKIYEVRLYVSSAADPSYQATISMARLRFY